MNNWIISDIEKSECIDKLANELITLRAKAGIQQEELAKIIGVSRQTYGEIERKSKVMSWGTYLSLIFFFDQNRKTHQLLRQTGVYSEKLLLHMNNGEEVKGSDVDSMNGFPVKNILESLDEQGLQSVKTIMMVEYARCKEMSGDAVIKAFDGRRFAQDITDKEYMAANALKNIKEKKS